MKFDFHIHSVYSDGSSKVNMIFDIAQKEKFSALAITDHDTTLGLKIVEKASLDYGVPYIPAVEFTAVEEGIKFHVLAYNIDLESKELKDYSKSLLLYLNNKSKTQIRLMQKNGIDIEEEEFFKESQGGPLYRAKLLKTLAKHGYIKEENIMSSIKLYFGKKGTYYIEDDYKFNSFEELCRLIRRNNGIVVLAHPGKIKKKNITLYNNLINSELLDGLEIYHPSNNQEVRKELLKIVINKDIIFTGGSDYHGDYNKKKTKIGDIYIPDEVYHNLKPYIKNEI